MTSCLLSLCLQGKRTEEKFMSRVSLIYAQCCSVVHKNCLSKKVHLIFSVTSIRNPLYHLYNLNDFHPCYGIFGRTSIFSAGQGTLGNMTHYKFSVSCTKNSKLTPSVESFCSRKNNENYTFTGMPRKEREKN